MTSNNLLRRRVARGAARLDMHYGKHWRALFGPYSLPNFAHFELCVLGRMEGSYHGGVMLLFPDPEGTRNGLRTNWQSRQAIDHGFVRGPKDGEDYYDRLLEAWKPELARRGFS